MQILESLELQETESRCSSCTWVKDLSQIQARPLNFIRIVYQTGYSYKCYDFQTLAVFLLEPINAEDVVRLPDTLYIIDGRKTDAFESSCVTLFIGSPQSDAYQSFFFHNDVRSWYLPVWTQDELAACRTHCYPEVPMDVLLERLHIYGGIPRSVFKTFTIHADMEEALADAEALRCVCYGGILISTHAAAHMLLHMITTDDGQYQFLHEALASKYVGEKLWDKHARHMITNFERVFPATPVIVLRHLFKIYGHRVFSSGGFSAENGLQCQNLQTNETSILALQDFGGVRVNLKQDSFPDKSIMQYLERSDDDQFPDIDSLSPHGLFLFVVGAERPLQEAETLRQLYGLYGNPKLYFVVPPQRFTKFAKQELVRRALKIWSSTSWNCLLVTT